MGEFEINLKLSETPTSSQIKKLEKYFKEIPLFEILSGLKFAMGQIIERLNTVSELADIVVTLTPCMSLIKGLAPSISTLIPQMHTSMEDLTNMFGDMLTDSSLSQESMTPTYQGNTDTDAILQEAHNVIEGKTKTAMPEPPTTTSQQKIKR